MAFGLLVLMCAVAAVGVVALGRRLRWFRPPDVAERVDLRPVQRANEFHPSVTLLLRDDGTVGWRYDT